VALQYISRQGPTPEQLAYWGDDWNGCKLYGSCQGKACKSGDQWRSPILFPSTSSRPPGVHPEDRRADRCPTAYVQPEDWRLLSIWSAWKQLGGMPSAGAVEDQEALLVEALSVLDSEQQLISLHAQERAEARAKASRGRPRG